MDKITFIIAVTGALLSTYTFIAVRLARIPKLRVFRFAPDAVAIDDDFNTLHVYTDGDFIVTNLSDKPNTVVRMDVSANLGSGWIEGTIRGQRLSERTETRSNYNSATGERQHHNEIVREWMDADVCPIMLSPQSSSIPNTGISLRFDFESQKSIEDLAVLRIRLDLHDQYGKRHSLDLDSQKFAGLEPRRFPRFYDDEREIGCLKDRIPAEQTDAVVRVVHRRPDSNPSQSTLSVRRYYKLLGNRKVANVAHLGRDGYAYDQYYPRDFVRRMAEDGDGPRELGTPDGFNIAFSVDGGAPKALHIRLPESWSRDRMEVPIPEDFARLCVADN